MRFRGVRLSCGLHGKRGQVMNCAGARTLYPTYHVTETEASLEQTETVTDVLHEHYLRERDIFNVERQHNLL